MTDPAGVLVPDGKIAGTPLGDLDTATLLRVLAWYRQRDARVYFAAVQVAKHRYCEEHGLAALSPPELRRVAGGDDERAAAARWLLAERHADE